MKSVICFLGFFVYFINISTALPRVKRNSWATSPDSKFQSRYNFTSEEEVELPIVDDDTFRLNPLKMAYPKMPNVCNDCVCGAGRKSRIVGGTTAAIGEFPWMVGMTKRGQFHCGGSLITRRHVLTAAHCLEGFDRRFFELYMGNPELDISSPDIIRRRVRSWTLHSDFNIYNLNNDIAIVELDRPVPLEGLVKTACLPENQAIDYTGSLATAIGWGKTSEGGEISNTLQKVKVPVLSDEECDEAGYQKSRRTENMFCAGYLEGERDACSGDSGGPLLVKGPSGQQEVIGITSFGRGCARPRYPGVYTKLTNYLGWLRDNLGGECICPPSYYEIMLNKFVILLLTCFSLMSSSISLPQVMLPSNQPQVSTNNRTSRFLFDEIFGIDVTAGDNDGTEEKLRNCTCECGVYSQEDRIVGGRPTEPHRYPWIARLVYEGRFHCGGSLLTNDYVLTAAHCLRRLKRSKLRIILGDHDQHTNLEAKAVMRAVSAIVRHRNFDLNSYNHDVALLKLRKPVEFTKTIRPICLPQTGSDPAGKEGTVVGWGRTMEGGMLPGVIHEVKVPIFSLEQCRKMKYKANRITPNMICAGKGSQDSCQGDSGGPLLVQEGDKIEIAGIVSWGVGCGRPGYPGVYTRVSRYLNWINTNMENTCLCK
ncbi:transmembrane protease serine 9-like [Chelonus insularis]|uniref:transmembrane protease serine 9-like n=1 Tax=Chelonus insularis TaxID=460826 RepID=UPI00158D47E2|nr:transmembrane protease serine 9-like [Chelonus insularis]